MKMTLFCDGFLVEAYAEYCSHFERQTQCEFDRFVIEPVPFSAWLQRMKSDEFWSHCTLISTEDLNA